MLLPVAAQTRSVFFPVSSPRWGYTFSQGSGRSTEPGAVRPELRGYPIYEHVTSCEMEIVTPALTFFPEPPGKAQLRYYTKVFVKHSPITVRYY